MDMFEKLGFLETRELWVLMKELKIPYCKVEEMEKEDLSTGEKKLVPKFVPRTDYETMKSDIVVALNSLNRDQRRLFKKKIDKIIRKRVKMQRSDVNG